MGAWYWIGVSAGFGAGLGVLISAFAGAARGGLAAVAVVSFGAGAALGYVVDGSEAGGWGDIVACA
ncbi:MAG: hypothetical protein ACRDLK_00385, partial [Gaiellaceae bacterium]